MPKQSIINLEKNPTLEVIAYDINEIWSVELA